MTKTKKDLYSQARTLKTKHCPPISKMSKQQLVKYIAGRSVEQSPKKSKPKTLKVKIKAPKQRRGSLDKRRVNPMAKASAIAEKERIQRLEEEKDDIQKALAKAMMDFKEKFEKPKKKTINPAVVAKMKARMPKKKQQEHKEEKEGKSDEDGGGELFKGERFYIRRRDMKLYSRIKNNIEGYEKDIENAGELRLSKAEIRDMRKAIQKQMEALRKLSDKPPAGRPRF